MAVKTFNAKKYTLHDCSWANWKFEGNYILKIDTSTDFFDNAWNGIDGVYEVSPESYLPWPVKYVFSEETSDPDTQIPVLDLTNIPAGTNYITDTDWTDFCDCEDGASAVDHPVCNTCCAEGQWWTHEQFKISECSWGGLPEEYENREPEGAPNKFKTNQKFPPIIGNQIEGDQVTNEEQTYYMRCYKVVVKLCPECEDDATIQEVAISGLDGEHQMTAPLPTIEDKVTCCGEFLGCKDNVCTKGYSESEYHPCIEEGAECFPPTNLPVIGGDPHVTTFFGEKFDM
jgi:hypothetical protein